MHQEPASGGRGEGEAVVDGFGFGMRVEPLRAEGSKDKSIERFPFCAAKRLATGCYLQRVGLKKQNNTSHPQRRFFEPSSWLAEYMLGG